MEKKKSERGSILSPVVAVSFDQGNDETFGATKPPRSANLKYQTQAGLHIELKSDSAHDEEEAKDQVGHEPFNLIAYG